MVFYLFSIAFFEPIDPRLDLHLAVEREGLLQISGGFADPALEIFQVLYRGKEGGPIRFFRLRAGKEVADEVEAIAGGLTGPDGGEIVPRQGRAGD